MIELAIAAIFAVESGNNPNPLPGDDGTAHGIAQIHEEVRIDVNKRYGDHYTEADCYDPALAKEIARKYLIMWCGPNASLEDYCRTWNGGPRWKNKKPEVKKRTFAYWKKCKQAIGVV